MLQKRKKDRSTDTAIIQINTERQLIATGNV